MRACATLYTTILSGLLLSGAGSGCGAEMSEDAVGAAITTAVAATVWVAGGGCSLQGCPWGTFCNHKEGLCEARPCGDGCPKGSYCNEQIDRCEDMPSVTQMNPPPNQPPRDPNLQPPVTAPIPF